MLKCVLHNRTEDFRPNFSLFLTYIEHINMKIFTSITFLFLIFVILKVAAQDEEIDPVLIKIKANILSLADSVPVPYANVLNLRTHSGTITNNGGYFTLEMLNIDSLIITSIGFQKSVLKVPANYSGYSTLNFYIQPVSYGLGEVKVDGEKPKVDLGFETGRPTELAPELRGDAFNDAPPVLAAFFNPISYWQYYLSKKEKRKREVRKEMVVQKNWEMHSQNYNKDKVMMLTGLNESAADSFMVWFNSQDVLPYLSSEYEVRATVIEFLHYYQIEKTQQASPLPSPK